MNLDIIGQLVVGSGMIYGLWRLTREVASLTATLRLIVPQVQSNTKRINALETGYAARV